MKNIAPIVASLHRANQKMTASVESTAETLNAPHELDDYPPYYPLDSPLVAMTPEDSHRFKVDEPIGKVEWNTVFQKGARLISFAS